MAIFNAKELKKLYTPAPTTNGEDNGQVTILGGSSLFKGAPLFSLKAASRIVDMVFFSSPEPVLEKISSYLHSELSSFIWVPFEEVEKYIEKSDAVLVGPGLKRFSSEYATREEREQFCDDECKKTRDLTKALLEKFPHKKWVVDAGSLQTMQPEWLPENAIITPNRREFELLFGDAVSEDSPEEQVQKYARMYNCIIVLKGAVTIVASKDQVVSVTGGNAGLTKGGSGDTQAGLTVALLAKNEPFLAAAAAAFLIKKSAEEIHTRVGTFFNADDVAEEIPRVLAAYTS